MAIPIGFYTNKQGKPMQAAQAAPQQQGGIMGSVGRLIENPFLMSLLAQSGYSPVPQSPVGAVGRALLGGQQIQQGQKRSALEEQLLRSQIGLNEARATTEKDSPVSANVQSTFKGENGNMYIVTRNGEVRDTGVAFSNNLQLLEQGDGSVVAVDRTTGSVVGSPITPEAAADASRRKDQVERAITLPEDLAGLDSTISKVDKTIGTVERAIGKVGPGSTGVVAAATRGIPGTPAFSLDQSVRTINANLGFDTLQQMRAASKTGGALGQVSERELDLLISAIENLNIAQDTDEVRGALERVVEHYNNYKREIEVMKNAMRQRAGEAAEDLPQDEPKRRRFNPATGRIE